MVLVLETIDELGGGRKKYVGKQGAVCFGEKRGVNPFAVCHRLCRIMLLRLGRRGTRPVQEGNGKREKPTNRGL